MSTVDPRWNSEASVLSTSPNCRVFPPDVPSASEVEARRSFAAARECRVTPADLTPTTRPCRTCGAPTASVEYRRPPGEGRSATFAGLPDEWLPALVADRFAGVGREGRVGLDCPRCAWLNAATASTLALAYTSLAPRWLRDHLRARVVAAGRQNAMADAFPDGPDALFGVGMLAITSAAFGPVLGQPPHRVPPRLAGLLRRHQSGDHGTLGHHGPADAAERRRGPILAPRAARGAMAIEDGKGDVLSRYPEGEGVLLVWTVLVPGEPGFTLVSVAGDKAGPSGDPPASPDCPAAG